jgi:hypothetical protein
VLPYGEYVEPSREYGEYGVRVLWGEVVVVYGEIDIEGLDKDAGRAGTEGVAVVIVGGSDDGDEAEGCEPACSHGLGGDAITVASKISREIQIGGCDNSKIFKLTCFHLGAVSR